MLRLIELEWLKFKKNGFMTVLMFIFVALFLFLIVMLKDQFTNLPKPIPSSTVFTEFPTVWEYQGYVGNWLVSLCLGFMVVYSVTSEVANKTMRQNIITGLTRKEFFLSKLWSVVVLSGFATLLYLSSSLVMGIVFTDGYDLELILDNNLAGTRFFLMSLGYLSFALFCGLLIRRGFLALLTYFIYLMILEPIIRGIHLAYLGKSKLASWYPMNVVEDNFPNPFIRYSQEFMKNDFNFLLSGTEAMLGTVMYILVFLGGAYWLFSKNDV